MNEEELVELSERIRERKVQVHQRRMERIDAELDAWKTIDFDEEGLKLAKQKETRVLQEIMDKIRSQREAEAMYEHCERTFRIYLIGYSKQEE